jgi:hypothetical protein
MLAQGLEQPAAIDAPATLDASKRPGLFRLGPFWLTPTFHIGTIGLDTNVFYTPSDRHTDLTASGGPGLDAVLPMGSVRFIVGGDVVYVYFVRTPSQRRLGGTARSRLEWTTPRLHAAAQESFERTFRRPGFEVDRRVQQDQWMTTGELGLNTPGRLGVRTEASSQRIDVAEGQTFLGADLRRALSRDVYVALLGVSLRLTPKTSLLAEGDYQLDRFRLDSSRDADSNRLYGGLRIESDTRLSMRAVGGVRLLRPKDSRRGGQIRTPYASVDVAYRFGPRTEFGGSYGHDLQFSAFDAIAAAPVITLETYSARLTKGLVGRFEILFSGRLTHLRSAGAITLQPDSGGTVVTVRNDTGREGIADLGYRFRPNFRIGVAAGYASRRSNVADLGIQGLLLGGTVTYTPGQH